MAQPIRTCVGCGARREKALLLRVVAEDGFLVADPQARRVGRGAYVCSARCAKRAVERKSLARSLRTAVAARPGWVEQLEQVLQPTPQGAGGRARG